MFARACGQQQECAPTDATPVQSAPLKGPQAVLVKHVSLAHGSKLEQGQIVNKTWSVQNNGQEAWPVSAKLIFLRGDRELLGETEEFPVPAAKPGQSVEVSVPITTPTKPGSYSAYFQLADADRNVFGPRLWLEVLVTRDDEDERKLGSGPGSSSSSITSSTPAVDTSGWVDVKVETSPVVKPAVAPTTVPATTLAPVTIPAVTVSAPVSAPVSAKPVANATVSKPTGTVTPVAPKYATQLASLAAMGFNNAELNAFLLEKHNGDIQQVTNWLLENMNH
jgi:next-to-BRCA1 protein 1